MRTRITRAHKAVVPIGSLQDARRIAGAKLATYPTKHLTPGEIVTAMRVIQTTQKFAHSGARAHPQRAPLTADVFTGNRTRTPID